MGWSIGSENGRDIGYGVPAICDQPGCEEEIDRGLAYKCGEMRMDNACGLYFCYNHLTSTSGLDKAGEEQFPEAMLCDVCALNWKLDLIDDEAGWKLHADIYYPKPDVLKWLLWKRLAPSWETWRQEELRDQQELNNQICLAKLADIEAIVRDEDFREDLEGDS